MVVLLLLTALSGRRLCSVAGSGTMSTVSHRARRSTRIEVQYDEEKPQIDAEAIAPTAAGTRTRRRTVGKKVAAEGDDSALVQRSDDDDDDDDRPYVLCIIAHST